MFGDWDHKERLKSSTLRESETVRRLINCNVKILQNKEMKIFCDNKNIHLYCKLVVGKKTETHFLLQKNLNNIMHGHVKMYVMR